MKKLKRFLPYLTGVLSAGLLTQSVEACAVCMGSADADLAPAMNASMMLLLVAIMLMASGFFGFFFYLARRDGLPVEAHQESTGR